VSTCQPIVGRGRELERIDIALSGLDDGQPGVLEVVGDPGIGKTRLLRELSSRAEGRGRLVLNGLAAEFERDVPFAVIVDALDGYLAAAGGREVERWTGPHLPELAGILPSLRELVPEREPVLPDERYRSHRSLRALLEGIAATRPLVLSLDDLQWADQASLELVATLLRRPPDAAVLVALAVRTGAEPAVVASARRVAAQSGSFERIELGPLTKLQATELLGPDANRAGADTLVIEAAGNPFFLTELARAKAPPESPGPPRTSNGGVPASVTAALEEELGDLEHDDIEFLRAAAVAGEPFEPDLAAEIAGLPLDRALGVLDRLAAAGIVRPTDVPRRFLFRHPLVLRAVYESAPVGWRLTAHGRAAEALAQRGAGAAQRAPASAVRWLRAALRLLPSEGPLADRRTELMGLLASSQAAIGQLGESEGTIVEMIRELPEDAGPVRMRLIATCATLKDLTGRHDEAREGLLQYRGVFDHDTSDAVALQTELAVNAFWGTDYAAMRDWAGRAVDSAASLEDPILRATAAAVLAYAEVLVGRIDDAERHRGDAAQVIDGSTDDALAPSLNALGHLGWAEYFLGRLEDSCAHFERSLDIARASRQGQYLTPLQMGQSSVLATLGRLTEAREVAEATVEAARLSGNRQALCHGLASVCWWAALAGDLEPASDAGAQGLALSDELGETALRVFAGGAVAELRLQANQPDLAASVLHDSCGGTELESVPPAWLPLFCEILTRANVASGDVEGARAAAERASSAAATLGLEIPRGHAKRSEAAILLALGKPELASEAAIAAATHDERGGAGVEAARSRLLAGRALVNAEAPERAADELRRAERGFESAGAVRLRKQATRELRRLGKRTRPARRRPGEADEHGLAALTGREREIAELVTDRKTNREIAEELVLSEKTIEAHLRNVFAKLGVSSRVDVARTIEKAGRQHAGPPQGRS
jgi:DNA-binding CsgD family transcriptional regulator